jgi:hypothetical protein
MLPYLHISYDAPPSSLMDSTASPKVKITEGEGVEVRSFTHNTSRVEGCVGVPGWGLERLTSKSITHTDLHKLNIKLVNAWLEHFGAQTNHRQTRTHKTHHSSDLREVTTFPLRVYYVVGDGTSTQMSFCPKIPKVGAPTTLGHNFGGP